MSETPIRFDTELLMTGKNTTGIIVPSHVLETLGAGKRPAVVAQVNDYSYRTTVGSMGGKAMLSFSAEHRAASGLKGGDEISVTITLDTAPREIVVPEDLITALVKAGVSEAFDKIAPSRRRADVANVVGAKAEATRQRRIEAILNRLDRS